ncbi:dephospho-CoA kinase [Psychroflexus montanilacus]|uniref:dephospho-CoA kinase n=1 Tax=Psychroflexus montanilacus TaxID=2873598 RepID=UPI001CCBAC8A|nr:dephospho-CoA kinase [Psychroflexus montanilacus]MBZ9651248.1 dephospho-CoA kinase [Psychroflexus montanilacus]
MKKIGLTGGIGSGKSTVANMFKENNVPVFIADIEAKKILDKPEVASEIAKTFNLDLNSEGLIHKPDLSAIVFNNTEALNKLNSIIHPKVHTKFENWLKKQQAAYIIYEAAIIFEKKRASDFDHTILVTAPEDTRIERVMARDGVGRDDVKSRMKAQWSESKKINLADFIIENINLIETRQRVKELHKKFSNISDK